jgi:ribonuclease III
LNDYKSALQQLAQSRGLARSRYTVAQPNGPEHAKLFTIEARVGGERVSHAEGPSKKVASQRAARILFEQLNGSGVLH